MTVLGARAIEPVRPDKHRRVVVDPHDEEEQDDDAVVFDQTPVRVSCPHCGMHVITFIEHESSMLTYAVSIILLLMLGWAALCIIPVVFPLLKDVVHHCPRCLNVLASRSRWAVSSFKEQVMSFRLGSCVVVLARKYVFLLMFLAACIYGVHVMRTGGGAQVGTSAGAALALTQPGNSSELSWQNFSQDCGFKSYLGNPIHVTIAFKDDYKLRSFRWQGTLVRKEDAWHLLWFNQRGLLSVHMEPSQFSQSPKRSGLVLVFSDDGDAVKDALELKVGEVFSFHATMVEVGRRGAPHTMALHKILPSSALGGASDGGMRSAP